MNTRNPFTLAVLQHRPTPSDIDASLARLAEQLPLAASQGARLLVCPEASLTGYNISLESARSIAVERDGACMQGIGELCREHATALAFGYIERCGENLFNAVMVFDDRGEPLAHYRKTHLWGDLDRQLFQAGDAYAPLFRIDGWKLGILICYDIEFPESSRHLALQGADIILAPTALMSPWSFVADKMTCVRAAENQVFFAYANYCGPENDLDYVGRSCIIGPDGEELARAGKKPELLLATLEYPALTRIRQDLPYHKDRRPELYQTLS